MFAESMAAKRKEKGEKEISSEERETTNGPLGVAEARSEKETSQEKGKYRKVIYFFYEGLEEEAR